MPWAICWSIVWVESVMTSSSFTSAAFRTGRQSRRKRAEEIISGVMVAVGVGDRRPAAAEKWDTASWHRNSGCNKKNWPISPFSLLFAGLGRVTWGEGTAERPRNNKSGGFPLCLPHATERHSLSMKLFLLILYCAVGSVSSFFFWFFDFLIFSGDLLSPFHLE